jgi:phage terminase small subunit
MTTRGRVKRKAPGAKKVLVAKKKPLRAGNSAEAKEERRHAFVEALIANGESITKAGIACGFSPKTAASQGSRLLKEVKTQELLEKRRSQLRQKLELSTERTLQEVARLAYLDPRQLFNADGTTKPIHELDPDVAAAIAGVEITHEWSGKGEDRRLVATSTKYKIADKNAALDKAMKHQGLYKADNLQRNPLEGLSRDTLKAIAERLGG